MTPPNTEGLLQNSVLPAAGLVLGLMLVEVVLGLVLKRNLYRLPDALSSLGSSLGQLVVQAMLGFTTLAMYTVLYDHLAVLTWPTGPLGWVLAFFVMELVFYWRHRAGHELSVLWTVHEVHHQSSEYNYAVAQRVGYLQWLHTACFIWPLAILGLDPLIFSVLFSGIHLYQFLIHTRLIGRLGPLEWVIMTPAHHRVHHARNPRYLDTNYGFTLLIFDQVFGTFQRQVEEPEYGTLTPLHSFSPLDNNIRPWRTLITRMLHAPSPWVALQLPFRHPSWDPVQRRRVLPAKDETVPPRQLPSERVDLMRGIGAVVAVLVATVGTLVLVESIASWPLGVRLLVGFVLLGLSAVATHVVTAPHRVAEPLEPMEAGDGVHS